MGSLDTHVEHEEGAFAILEEEDDAFDKEGLSELDGVLKFKQPIIEHKQEFDPPDRGDDSDLDVISVCNEDWTEVEHLTRTVIEVNIDVLEHDVAPDDIQVGLILGTLDDLQDGQDSAGKPEDSEKLPNIKAH